jgi:tryptophanyl-tRNA synthetase
MKKRLFSGIQPTGSLHLGNYLGAIHTWISLQNQHEALFCIVDLHAITNPQDAVMLKARIRELAALIIAAGVSPDRSFLFVQSHISAHAELAWILNCTIPYGWLKRMTQFKEKSSQEKKDVTVGLFDYPVLMAADILLYDTDLVPVGEDQKQHLEFTRDIAKRFNAIYGHTFKLPNPYIPKTGARIMGLDNPLKKMSKSETSPFHAVYLLDSPKDIQSKIGKAKTDSLREVRFDENRPGIHNLLVIYECLTGMNRTTIESRFADYDYQAFKKELAEVIIDRLRLIQSQYAALMKDTHYIDQLLAAGAGKVRPMAQEKLADVKLRVGLG